jgi:hypothetical protein
MEDIRAVLKDEPLPAETDKCLKAWREWGATESESLLRYSLHA